MPAKQFANEGMPVHQFYVTARPGLRISVLDFGGSGPNLLIANANGFHGLCYHELANHLLTSFHCYAIDLRGMGDSHMRVSDTLIENGDYAGSHDECLRPSSSLPTLEGFAADIDAVVEQLSWKELYLFGHSSGGCAVLAAALKLGDRVKGLYIYEPINVDPETMRRLGEVAPVSGMLLHSALRRRNTFPSREAAVHSFGSRAWKNWDKAVLRSYVSHGFRELPEVVCDSPQRPLKALSNADGSGVELKCSKTCEALVYCLIERMSVVHWEGLPTITCPATVGAGPGDFGGKEVSERSPLVAKQLGNGRFERIHLGHFAPFEDPNFFAGRLLAAFAPATSKL